MEVTTMLALPMDQETEKDPVVCEIGETCNLEVVGPQPKTSVERNPGEGPTEMEIEKEKETDLEGEENQRQKQKKKKKEKGIEDVRNTGNTSNTSNFESGASQEKRDGNSEAMDWLPSKEKGSTSWDTKINKEREEYGVSGLSEYEDSDGWTDSEMDEEEKATDRACQEAYDLGLIGPGKEERRKQLLKEIILRNMNRKQVMREKKVKNKGKGKTENGDKTMPASSTTAEVEVDVSNVSSGTGGKGYPPPTKASSSKKKPTPAALMKALF